MRLRPPTYHRRAGGCGKLVDPVFLERREETRVFFFWAGAESQIKVDDQREKENRSTDDKGKKKRQDRRIEEERKKEEGKRMHKLDRTRRTSDEHGLPGGESRAFSVAVLDLPATASPYSESSVVRTLLLHGSC